MAAKSISRQHKPLPKNVSVDNKKSIFDNVWVSLGILLVFWLIFFRELITGSSFLFDDFVHQYYPGKTMLAVALSKGIIPFWNPYTFVGMPFFADIQIAIFYPFNTILSLFVNGDKLSPLVIQFTIIIHYLLCSVFTFFVGKELKYSNFASVIFAVLFTYSSYMIIHMIHMPLIEALVWLPLVFLLWLKFMRTGKYWFIWTAAIVMALSVLGGYPQVAFFNYLFILVFVFFKFLSEYLEKDYSNIKKYIFGLIIFFGISIGLTAFQLLPANEFVSLSNRATIDWEFAKQGSLHPLDFLTFFIPKFFGVWNWNETTGDLKYWSKHQDGPWMFSIANVYIAAVVVLLFIPALIYNYKSGDKIINKWFVIIMLVFSFSFALGGNFFAQKLFFDFIPVFNRFRNPAHILYIAAFILSLLTAKLFDVMVYEKIKAKGILTTKYFIIFGGAFILFTILVLSGTFSGAAGSNQQVSSWISKQFFWFAVFLIPSLVLVYLYLNDKLGTSIFTLSVVLVLLLDVYVSWFTQNNSKVNPEDVYNQHSQVISFIKDKMKDEVFRVNMREGGEMLLERNQGMTERIPLLEGYGALLLNKYAPFIKADSSGVIQQHSLLNVKYRISPGKGKQQGKLTENPDYLKKGKMFYDVKVLQGDTAIKKYMESKEFDYKNTLVLEKMPDGVVLPDAKDTNKKIISDVKLTSYNLNDMSFDVETSENGFLFMSEVFYPAFKAYIDGNPTEILRADYCLRALYIEKGKHKIEIKYESDVFATGLKVSLISLLIFAGGFIWTALRFKNKKGESIEDSH